MAELAGITVAATMVAHVVGLLLFLRGSVHGQSAVLFLVVHL